MQARKRDEVLSWLSRLNFASIQNETFGRTLKGSGRWFLEHPKFQSWLSGSSPILWSVGIRKYGDLPNQAKEPC